MQNLSQQLVLTIFNSVLLYNIASRRVIIHLFTKNLTNSDPKNIMVQMPAFSSTTKRNCVILSERSSLVFSALLDAYRALDKGNHGLLSENVIVPNVCACQR